MQNESANCHIFVTFGQFEIKHLVNLLNLQTGREKIVAVVGLSSHIVAGVVFILYLAEYLLDDVLKRDKSAGAAKLIHHYSDGFFLLHEDVHEFLGCHCLGHIGQGAYAVAPFLGIAEHLR